MCGIIGELRRQSGPSEADWPRLTHMIARRGPDDEGFWSSDERCTLAFRRLSILDLSAAGHEPMLSPDGAHALVFNGELYNFRDLRDELKSCGHQFRSSGDAEVALIALREWGSQALERFNGMFALGFYSARERRLLLARDHAGMKPIYVLHDRRGWVFASQYDQLLAHPWCHGRIAKIGRSLYLRLGYVPAPHAIIEGTEMLEPGTWLQVQADGREQRGRFFDFPRSVEADLRGAGAVRAIDQALEGAVRRHMMSDVPVGSFLSGGIDSPLVTAEMVKTAGVGLPAFTIGTESAESDESDDAARYAREIGVEHITQRVSADDALAILPEVVNACGEPFADYSIIPTMLVSRLAAERVKVVLSGDGGDELFFGYTGRFGSVLRVAEQFAQPLWLRDLRYGVKKFSGIGSATHDIRRPSIGSWYRSRHTRISEDRLRRILPELGGWPSSYNSFDYRGARLDETAQWMRWIEYQTHLTMVLLKVDRASMHHSLEVRVPLLDLEVIRAALRTDWRSLLDLGSSLGKLPLRRLLSERIPFQTTAKRGFSVPMDAWLRGSLRSLFEERLFDRRELLGLELDTSAVRNWFGEHLSRVANHDWGLWLILSAALWEDRYLASGATRQ